MSKGVRKFLSYLYLPKFLSTVFPTGKMVRYFQNPYEERKIPAKDLSPAEITQQINEYAKNILQRYLPSNKNVDGGLYVGVTGVSYMFYHLSKNPVLSENRNLYMDKALEYLKPALKTSAGDKTSFLLGDAGTFALAIVLYRAIGDNQYKYYVNKYRDLYPQYLNPNFLECGSDEFFVGRAGYLAGALWIGRELQNQIFSSEELYKICDIMVESGREYAKKQNSPCPLMYHYYKTQYLGAAHGLSFILQILMTVPGYLEYNKEAAQDVKITVEFIASLQTNDGNWPCCMEEYGLNDHKLVHWCHGAPGIIHMMARAFITFKNPRFLNSCIQAGNVVWEKGLLRKGPGICHGVAGNAYVFLVIYRLTNNEEYVQKAKCFANFLSTDEFLQDARLPDNPETLFEGTAGTVCFLADLMIPDQADFPFHNIFSS